MRPMDKAARIAARQNAILKSVLGARIYDLVRETPLSPAPKISAMIKNAVHLKREDMQEVFSFKIRGAYHKMTRLPPARLRRGVVAASAGNHAQGVALAAQRLRCRASIVMPRYAQKIKVAAVRARGAKVVLHGETFDDADQFARRLATEECATFISPFDDADIIAGNGTIAAEILRQHPMPLHAVFCAVGGGGLAAGIAAYIKALRPGVRVIGVEAEESASMRASLRAGKPVRLSHVGAFADAVAVKKPGRLPFELVRALADDIIAVGNDEICAAVKDLYEDTRVIFEPGGALALAGAKYFASERRLRGKNIIVVAGGANMNFDRLRFVSERAEIGEQREALFAVTIPERPGSFRRFCALLGGRDITEFNYRLDDRDSAHIFVGIAVREAAERRDVSRELRAAGLPAIDLTDDEMAKLHLRHLVGGRARAENELLHRFEFPERPGALMNFLDLLDKSRRHWNISLFHYRNNGGDAGRVLVGVQVPPAERRLFARALRELNYPHHCETDNPACRLFLQGDLRLKQSGNYDFSPPPPQTSKTPIPASRPFPPPASGGGSKFAQANFRGWNPPILGEESAEIASIWSFRRKPESSVFFICLAPDICRGRNKPAAVYCCKIGHFRQKLRTEGGVNSAVLVSPAAFSCKMAGVKIRRIAQKSGGLSYTKLSVKRRRYLSFRQNHYNARRVGFVSFCFFLGEWNDGENKESENCGDEQRRQPVPIQVGVRGRHTPWAAYFCYRIRCAGGGGQAQSISLGVCYRRLFVVVGISSASGDFGDYVFDSPGKQCAEGDQCQRLCP